MGDIVWRHKCAGGVWTLKTAVLVVTESVVGTKVVKKGERKCSMWWTEEVREVVKEKKRGIYSIIIRNLYKEMFLRE